MPIYLGKNKISDCGMPVVKSGTDVSGVTATAADVLAPKVFVDSSGAERTGTMATVTQATPTIAVSAIGLIEASATQSAGYVSSGTKSATKQLTTKSAATYTPGISSQTIPSGLYLTGTQTIAGDSNLVAENIKSGVSIFGVGGSYSEALEAMYVKKSGTEAVNATGWAGGSGAANTMLTVNIDDMFLAYRDLKYSDGSTPIMSLPLGRINTDPSLIVFLKNGYTSSDLNDTSIISSLMYCPKFGSGYVKTCGSSTTYQLTSYDVYYGYRTEGEASYNVFDFALYRGYGYVFVTNSSDDKDKYKLILFY